MARQRKSHEERREEIVRGALEVAAESGVKEVTTQAIADRVGIAQPTIFRHFKTRDQIFAAAMEWIAKALFAALERGARSDAPPDERLQSLLRRQLEFVARHRGLPRLLFSDRLHLEDPTLKATVRRVMERYVRHVESILRDGIAAGMFRADLEPTATAWWIAATVQGLIMRWSLHDFEFPLEDEASDLWRFLEPVLRKPAPQKT